MGDIALRGNKLTKRRGQAALGGTRDRPGRHPPVKQPARRADLFGGGRTNLLEELGRVEGERSNPNRRAEISRVHGELNRGYAIGGVVKKAIKKLRPAGPFKPKKKAFKTHGKDVPTMAAKGGRIGLNKGGKPWGTGPKPGTHEFLLQQINKPRKKKAIGGPAAGAIKGAIDRVLKPKGVFKKDSYKRPWEKPPQLKKSDKERREELRKKARKSGGHSKIIFADEWDKIDPGLQKGLFKKDGGRAGLKKGGKSDKNWIQKAVNPKHKGFCTPMTKKTCTPRRKALARTFKENGS